MHTPRFTLGVGASALTCLLLPPPFLGAQAPSQAPQATFRLATNLVEVDVVVHDENGRFVAGLTADDLDVYEDGQPQQIQHFYLVAHTGGSVAPVTDVSTSPGDKDAHRLFVFLFDESHLGNESLLRIKVGVERFIQAQFRPGDLGGIFSAGAMYRGRLTQSKNDLLTGLRAVTPAFDSRERLLMEFRAFPPIPSEADALRIDYGDTRLVEDLARRACFASPPECALAGGVERVENRIQNKARDYVRQARIATARTIDNLRHVALSLASIPGRKTVVFLSDGFMADESRSEIQQVAALAARGGTAFYSVYGRGSSIIGGQALPDVVTQQPGLNSTFDSTDDGPEILTAGTGGFVVRNANDVSRALGLVARDTSTYYVMGYQPINNVMDGKVRKIEVRARARGLRVRARKSYLASPLPPMQSLRIGG